MELLKSELGRIALLIAEVILLISCSSGKSEVTEENSLTERGLKERVKFLTETEYNAEYMSGAIQKVEIIYRSYELFNEEGNLLERKIYDSNATLLNELCFKYDNYGKLIELVNSDSRTIYMYDSNGNEVENRIFSQGGVLKEKCTSRYDKKGRKIEEIHFNADNILVLKYFTIYEANGKSIETKGYKLDSTLEVKNTLKYDEKGKVIEKTHLYIDTKYESKDSYKYDQQGQMIEHIESLMGRTERYSFIYDDYDGYGNWQYKLQTEPPMSITEREIVYY